MKIAVLFPGQGSQFLGMGKDFLEQDSDSRALMAMAEAACEAPLSKLCGEGPMEELTRAAVLQPAITIVNLICWRQLLKHLPNDLRVSCVAGHSLGEYAALCAAEVLTVEDTIRLVAKRGSLMEREGDKNPGGMRAVLGLSIDKLETAIAEYGGEGVATIANHNTPEQIVLSGSIPGLDGVGRLVEALGGKVIPLNVSVANHSPLVSEAIPDFAAFIAPTPFAVPAIPVYCNVTAAKESEPSRIKELMAKQIGARVRWCEIIGAMLAEGVDTFIEAGPKNVLKGMIKKIAPKGSGVSALQFDSPATLESCLEQLRQGKG